MGFVRFRKFKPYKTKKFSNRWQRAHHEMAALKEIECEVSALREEWHAILGEFMQQDIHDALLV